MVALKVPIRGGLCSEVNILGCNSDDDNDADLHLSLTTYPFLHSS